MSLKLCSACLQEKPLTVQFYHRNRTSRDGFQAECRPCRSIRAKYDQRRKERQATPEHRAYACRATKRARTKPKGFFLSIVSEIRQRSRRFGLSCDVTRDWLMEVHEKQAGLCALTGDTMTFTIGHGIVGTNCSVDRIDPNGGYTKDNVQLVCLWANIMKGPRTVEQLLEVCREILAANGRGAKQ